MRLTMYGVKERKLGSYWQPRLLGEGELFFFNGMSSWFPFPVDDSQPVGTPQPLHTHKGQLWLDLVDYEKKWHKVRRWKVLWGIQGN